MKVALVCPYDWSFPGGVKSHITGLASALAERDVQVEIIAPATKDHEDIIVAGRSLPVPANGSVARLCFSRSAKTRIARRLAEGDIDIVHLHEPAIPSISLLALMASTLPAVATFHASAERSAGYAIAKPVLDKYLKTLKERIVVSKAALSLITTYFPGSYSVIPNGVDFKRFAAAEPDEQMAALKPFVLFVGRPEPRKGLSVAVDALARVRDSMPNVNLVAVGPAPADLPPWAHGFAAVDHQRLAQIYKAADAFCAPSLGGESFGIVLAEAMSAGTPVVCSDLPGYLEAAQGAAVHVPVGDIEATSKALIEVLTDKEAASDLRAKGTERASRLDWSLLVDDVLSRYEAAVS
ncbi:MAG: glycosyltransferase family 4 protein [Actinomycetota bacterium]|nr:glycosyltransferase family 4 protein [Actinomycetota bacterium]